MSSRTDLFDLDAPPEPPQMSEASRLDGRCGSGPVEESPGSKDER